MLYNQEGLQLVDVVVDPRLSVHLRPHQKEGVVFLYECVSGMREYSGQGAILAYVHVYHWRISCKMFGSSSISLVISLQICHSSFTILIWNG